MSKKVWTQIGIAVTVVLIGLVVWLARPASVVAPLSEEGATSTSAVITPEVMMPTTEIIGTSVEGRPLTAYTYGTGKKKLLFVGGVHGGYEWNSVFLAYKMMDYLTANPDAIPANLSVTIVPALNPDGVFAVVGVEGRFTVENVPDAANTTGVGRFNAHDVDLNRNFDCKWKRESSWRGKVVNAGTQAFSEPEAAALRDYVLKTQPTAAVFWHSAANTVYGSECETGVLPETRTLMNLYATTASYERMEKFDAYPITGDAEGWLASINIPAVTVELGTHDRTDWERNLAGVLAVLAHYKE